MKFELYEALPHKTEAELAKVTSREAVDLFHFLNLIEDEGEEKEYWIIPCDNEKPYVFDPQLITRARMSRQTISEASRKPQELQQTFNELVEMWRKETGHLSSITQKIMHPAYQRIIGMGPAGLPLILRELERRPSHWFWALNSITGEDPVPPEDAGVIKKMADAWIRWGKEKGLL